MSVIRADEVAKEDLDEAAEGAEDVKVQYVFTMTDGGFAKRTRISEYRTQSRGGLGIKAMSLANEERGGLVGAFIVVEGDEILSITSGGQVVRSPINADFRATGRSTMGVKFVTPKNGDSVAVVARSVEKVADEAAEEAGEPAADVAGESAGETTGERDVSADAGPDATIEDGPARAPEEE
jgi:DNA gyrase subunit A